MAETPTGSTIDARLREYLDGELRRAEADFPHLRLGVVQRSRGRVPMATLLGVAIVLLVAVIAGSQFLAKTTGPAAIQFGADGLPTSIGGQPVLRGDEIAKRLATGRPFLAGGMLALASDPCAMVAQPSAAPCTESWKLTGESDTAPSFGLLAAASAPGFVRTSGAPTIVRVEAPAPSASASHPCAGCAGTLAVDAVVWRRPTKGPMPPGASPPEGGSIFEALVPDFVAATNREGAIAGYVPKAYLIGPFPDLPGSPSNPPQPPPDPVYGDDLRTLVGHVVAGIGFVPLGATAPPADPNASVAPSAVATIEPASPRVDCGRIAAVPCAQAIALARAGREAEVGGASAIVVDDICAPLVACDRLYPFDAIAVFVTAGADTTGWYAFEVTGLEYSTPTQAQPLTFDIPAHIVARLTALTQPIPSHELIPSVEPTAEPSPSGAADVDPMLVCGQGGAEFRASVLEAPAELTGSDSAIRALRSYLAGGAYPGMPADGWRTVVASDVSVTFLARGTATWSTWWFITMVPDPAGGWHDSEEGECRLSVRLPTTMSYAEWRLDPGSPPKPGATSVTLLATELSCASGRPPGERLQAPVVVETSTTVTITLLVGRLGNADCPSNPAVPVVVRLTSPLGSRTLLDGSTYPATQR